MKKILFSVLAVFSLLVLFTACDGMLGGLFDEPPEPSQKKSLQEKIDNAKAGDIIDLSDESLVIDENGSFTITKKLTIKNGDTKNASFTVKADGVEFINLSNIKTIIASEELGDGDLTIKNCNEIESFYVNGGGSDSVHIAGTIIATLWVEKEDVRIVLELGTSDDDSTSQTPVATTVKNVQIKVNCKLESSDSSAVFEQVLISNDVEKVTLAGSANVEKLIVEISDDENQSNSKPSIEVISENVVIEKTSDNVEIVVPEDSDFDIPETEILDKKFTVKTIVNGITTTQSVYLGQSISLDNPTSEGYVFEGWFKDANFTIPVTFPLVVESDITLYAKFTEKKEEIQTFTVKTVVNGTTTTQTVNSGEPLTLATPSLDGYVFEGWFKDAEFTIPVTFPLVVKEDITLYAKFIQNKPTTDNTKDLLAEAVDLLLDLKIDEGVAKIKEAYSVQKNNETTLYYALAELASISVDQSVATLFKDNFGVKNYPAKMNSLISGDWMKEYPVTRNCCVLNVYQDESGSFVRVNADETSYDEYAYQNGELVNCEAYFDGEDWMWGYDYNIGYLTNITLDENGKYLVEYDYLPDYIDVSSATKYDSDFMYKGFEEYRNGGYVKFSGTKVDIDNYLSTWFVLDDFGTWIDDSYLHQITNITLDENGKYLVRYDNLPYGIDYSNATKYSWSWNDDGSLNVYQTENGSYVRVSGKEISHSGEYYLYKNGNWVRESASFTDITVGSGEYYTSKWYLEDKFDCTNITQYRLLNKIKQVQIGTSLLPEFNEVSWFKDTGLEVKFGSTHTAYSVMNLMLVNAIECNQTGLNNAIDNMLAIFNSKFANAKALASSITNASVEVPAKVFDAFGLKDLLGQDALKIGKAELNVFVASMEIIKGTLEWIASYDWTLNVDPIKNAVIQQNEESLLACFEDVFTANTLNVRNASAMTASKASFVSAISLIEESYNYLVGDTSEYPKAYIDEIKEVGDVYLEGANLLKDAIQSGGVFYVPEYFEPEDKWPTTAANTCMQIDFGKFFQAGYFSDIIDRNAEGKVVLYINAVGYYWDEDDNYVEVYDFGIPFTSFDTIAEDIQSEIERRGIDTSLVQGYYQGLAFRLDSSLIVDCVGNTIFGDEVSDSIYIPIY